MPTFILQSDRRASAVFEHEVRNGAANSNSSIGKRTLIFIRQLDRTLNEFSCPGSSTRYFIRRLQPGRYQFRLLWVAAVDHSDLVTALYRLAYLYQRRK